MGWLGIEEKYESKIKGITEDFNEFINTEIPKYKKLLIDSKLKTEEEVKDMKDKYMRSLAEVDNVRNIAKRDVQNATTYASQKFAK